MSISTKQAPRTNAEVQGVILYHLISLKSYDRQWKGNSKPFRSHRAVHVHQIEQKMCCLRVFLCLLVVFVYDVHAMYDPDEVLDLPGMSFKPNYRQWSGYLKASSGKFLHYW